MFIQKVIFHKLITFMDLHYFTIKSNYFTLTNSLLFCIVAKCKGLLFNTSTALILAPQFNNKHTKLVLFRIHAQCKGVFLF